MTKTAAARSQARRAALTKGAQALPFNPAQVLGYAGMLGGGALAGDAAMNGEQSTFKRVGKGVLGAGLAYAGYKALTDPTAQDIIRTGTQRAMDYIRRFLRKTAEDRTASLSKQAQVKLLAGAARAAGLRKALSSGEVVLPKARSTKQLISEAVGNLRGERSLGWPLPAYPGRNGRDNGLLDLLDHLRATGTARAGVNHRVSKETLVTMLRRLNGTSSLPGPETAAAFRAGAAKPFPVGLDRTTLLGKGGKKTAEAAYAEGFCKAAETLGVDTVTLYKQAAPWAAIGKLVSKGLGAARSLGGSAARLSQAAGAAAARTRAGQAAMSAGQRYLGLLRGGNVAQLQSKSQNLRSLAGRYNLDAMTAPSPELVAKARGVAGRAMRQAGRAEGMLANEQRAVDLARVGTAGGLGAAAMLALRGGKPESLAVQGGLLGSRQDQELGRQLASRRSDPISASEMMRRGWLNA